jgi:hypothetical protein
MMRVIMVVCACALSASAAFEHWMPSRTGDARLSQTYTTNSAGMSITVGITPPPVDTHDYTITGWYRFDSFASFSNNIVVFPVLTYTPSPVARTNPDLLANAGGHTNGGFTLSGSHTFTNFPFAPYPAIHAAIQAQWPWGVYTVAGDSSNAVTVSLAGAAAVTLGPGAWTRNIIAGTANSNVVVTGDGPMRIGISKTPLAEFFGASSGVGRGYDTYDFSGMASNPAAITNGHALFFTFRMHLDATNHTVICGGGCDGAVCTGYVVTNALPVDGTTSFSSSGMLNLNFIGVYNATNKFERIFDIRAFPRELSDNELERIKNNGSEEINRRGY